ncbi:hypothetical protein M408DRAFT_328121 [Serendipita vermifera MAFF 305830]|uniref:Isochorismatase-like domain-containing protein n=1 Tax=Serendipita vermifera MAFF 305830 TaxID=933852 RepID=A0A0C3BEK9_SERVB|nr:hypothetical protein M408DRAFT_328121 [Serendipita vermifera MAFF 305830]
MSALIIIDLQNEFLSGPSAPFKIDPGSHDLLKTTLTSLVPSFRASGGHIIWVKSHYAPTSQIGTVVAGTNAQEPPESVGNPSNAPPTTSDHLSWVIEGTHTGKKPCCQEGSFGAELVPWTKALQHSDDTILIKTFFSAFKETELEKFLVEKSLIKLYFGGLLSNMCVLATSLTAAHLAARNGRGWEVNVIVDALGWRREQSHLKALESLKANGVRLVDSEIFTKPELIPVGNSTMNVEENML